MTPQSRLKLGAACEGALERVAAKLGKTVSELRQTMSTNVAVCQDSSRSNPRLEKRSQPQSASSTPQPGKRLFPRQLTAIEMLLAGCTVVAAARRLGVSARTIFRWLKDPVFQSEIDRRADLADRFRRAQEAIRVHKR
jgi:DNA-binding NarL/FixJ family response regulator